MTERAENMKPSELRERAMNDLATILTLVYGARCSRKEGGCLCCVAWTVYDAIDQLTDASYLDDAVPQPQHTP